MAVRGFKRGALAASGLLIAALAALVVVAITVLIVAAGSGADPSDAFTEAPLIPADIAELVTWEPDAPDLVRSVEPTTRDGLAATWVRGHAAIERAIEVGDLRPLETWFSDGGLVRAKALSTAPSATAEVVVWEHHEADVRFYSLDGQIVGLNITATGRLSGQLIAESFEVVMALRDGNWRIERFERTAGGLEVQGE